ncbi:Mur ligase [Aspergillus ambiguus]|uniref:bifunctional folylpolyglutamate synthase/dihydrofolate synthase n=1 Tax=Aspergillus ambiguus TaxID=176160 RepID=UPI003CCD5165
MTYHESSTPQMTQESISLLKRHRRPFPSATPQPMLSSNGPRAPNASTLKGIPPLEGMKDWLLLLGHTVRTTYRYLGTVNRGQADDLDRLNVIHVAGTKGKGSTCAYVDSFLREHAARHGISRKIGLYTSPSLWPRHRIRIDSNPLPEDLFVNRILEVSRGLSLDFGSSAPAPQTPGFLQMMAIIAFHTFIKEGVNVVICETHHGGEFDATNFIRRPAITAITKIGMDHVDNLGRSFRDIAWHKTGIFREGVLALSVPQDPEAADEIKRRAEEKGALLLFVEDVGVEGVPLEQRENCVLATQIANRFLQLSGHSLDEGDIAAGIEKCHWAGRFDIVRHPNCTWYLDGAHNETSMNVVAEWYERVTSPRDSVRVLMFAHFSPKRTRDWTRILGILGASLQTHISHVIFVNQIEFDDHFTTPEGWLEEYAQFWANNWPGSSIYRAASVKDGINQAKRFGAGAQILVTGSLYLVEAALEIVKTGST